MRHAVLAVSLAVAFMAAVACSSSGSSGDVSEETDGGDDAASIVLTSPPGSAGTGLATGLPCDVQAIIENRCIACHDGNTAGAPKMLDYADLLKPSSSAPSKSIAVLSLERMKSTTSPMPPPPAVGPDAEEIQTFQEWVDAGTPKGAVCTEPPPDGGALDAGDLPDAGADAGNGCVSGKMWTNGNQGSAMMHPGVACNACHQVMGGPNLRIAGTAYRAPHDVNDCNGAAPPPTVTVTITDSKGKTATANVNAAGNFDIQGGQKLTAPYSASLSDGAKTRKMNGKVTSGDCNSCHTAAGINGAPGRILIP